MSRIFVPQFDVRGIFNVSPNVAVQPERILAEPVRDRRAQPAGLDVRAAAVSGREDLRCRLDRDTSAQQIAGDEAVRAVQDGEERGLIPDDLAHGAGS